MLAQLAYLRLSVLMSLRTYVPAPLCLRSYVAVPLCPCPLTSCALLCAPLCRVSLCKYAAVVVNVLTLRRCHLALRTGREAVNFQNGSSIHSAKLQVNFGEFFHRIPVHRTGIAVRTNKSR